MMTNKFTAELIYNRVASKYPKKIKEYHIRNFIEWCATCEIEWIGDPCSFDNIEGYEIEVKEYRALMPCNIYSLRNVYRKDGVRLFTPDDYSYNENYLFLDNCNMEYGYICIDYLGIPINERGLPLMERGHEVACELFCQWNMFAQDNMEGKIKNPRWYESLSIQLNDAIDDAKSSHRNMTNDEHYKVLLSINNIIPNLNKF